MPNPTTMKVVHPDDPKAYMIINERDFDARVHTQWDRQQDSDSGAPVRELTRTKIADLPAALADVDDPALVEAARDADSRKSQEVADAYDARLAELVDSDEDADGAEGEGEEGEDADGESDGESEGDQDGDSGAEG